MIKGPVELHKRPLQTEPCTLLIYSQPPIKYTPLSRHDFDSNIIKNWAEIRITKPPIRRTNLISFIYDNYYYIYGGRDINEGSISDMQRVSLEKSWKNQQWEVVTFTGLSPGKITNHKSVLIANILYVFGGDSQQEHITNNLFLFNVIDKTWKKQTFPLKEVEALSSHNMSLYQKSIVVFGGYSEGVFNNKAYILETETMTWKKYPSVSTSNSQVMNDIPEGRIDHSQLTIGDSVYIYAGQNREGNYLSDMWRFDMIEMQWHKIIIKGEIPKGRKGHSAVLYEGNMFIFGGKTGTVFEINQFWKFDVVKEKFMLLHDTMLERAFEDEANSTFSSMYNPKMAQTNPPRQKNPMNMTVKSKKNGLNEISKMNRTTGNSTGFHFLQKTKHNNILEQIALGTPKAKLMQSSLIYKIDADDQAFIHQLSQITPLKAIDKIRYKTLPLPRDGHSAFIHNDRMYIFGGDRNKYPFNDFFMFQFK